MSIDVTREVDKTELESLELHPQVRELREEPLDLPGKLLGLSLQRLRLRGGTIRTAESRRDLERLHRLLPCPIMFENVTKDAAHQRQRPVGHFHCEAGGHSGRRNEGA